MLKPEKDDERENRILMEVVVDAYDSEERAMGWYYYLADTLQFPFVATCIKKCSVSPLKPNATVEVVDIADADDCTREMFVEISWDEDETLAVPLSQLSATPEADSDTQQAIADWHYWCDHNYQF